VEKESLDLLEKIKRFCTKIQKHVNSLIPARSNHDLRTRNILPRTATRKKKGKMHNFLRFCVELGIAVFDSPQFKRCA